MALAELAPYVDSVPSGSGAPGSVGAGALAAALAKTQKQLGHEVTVALPLLDAFTAGLMVSRRLTPLTLADGGQVTVHDAQLPSGVKLVLFDRDGCFKGEAPFADEDADQLAERVGTLVKAVRALCEQRAEAGQGFDAVHLFDWPVAPVALTGIPCRTVLTITDIARQGSFPARASEVLGIPKDRAGEARSGNRVSTLKAGISGADVITALSESHAQELTQESHAGALSRALASRSDALFGVDLGVDYALFNPATDAALARRYDAEDPSGKELCKTALLRALELELAPARPLMLFPRELTREAGADWLLQAIPSLLANELILVVPGVGDASLVSRLTRLKERYTDQLRVLPRGIEGEASLRRLLSAADFCLLTPRVDHTALDWMLAARYGAVPVAHAVGALAARVVDADAELVTGTGFLFDDASAAGLSGAASRAVTAYHKPRFAALRRQVLRSSVSWDRPARRFQQLYRG